ncbi:MAG: hypothetical protein NT040_15140 [Bacteroidetes bacterium]|nr:hypothetical protein [Bacteroidota bacterium]
MVNKLMVFILLLLMSETLFSQIDNQFWFVAPDISATHGDSPINIRLSSMSDPVHYQLVMPSDPTFVPIEGDIGANTTQTISMDLFKTQLENSPPDVVLHKGLKLVTDNLVTAYYEEASANNPAIFSLKGQNALGTEFYIVSQNSYKNHAYADAYESFEIVATEDNTTVTIVPSDDVVNYPANSIITVILPRAGDTYSVRATHQAAGNTLAGSHIVSDKPVAVTWTDDSIEPGAGGYDVAGDQLVPVTIIGTEYIAIKGSAGNGERVYFVGTAGNTDIYIDGVLFQTIGAGQLATSYLIPSTSTTAYIQTSHPVYVLHLSGFSSEPGASMLPQIFCTGSKQIGFVRTSTGSFTLMILTLAGNENSFTMTPDPLAIQASDFLTVPFTSGLWKYAQKTLSTSQLQTGSHLLSNSTGKFHLGIINNLGGSAEYGYFSYFSSINLGNDRTICPGSTTTLNGGEGWDTYLWEKEEGALWTIIGTAQTIGITDQGHYRCSVTGQNCSLQDDIHIFLYPASEPEITGDASVCVHEINVAYEASVNFPPYNWSIIGGTFTGQGTSSIVADWTTAGSQAVTLTCTNQYGCTVQKNYAVEVHTLPAVTITPGSAPSICQGETVDLTASGGTGFVWSNGSTSATITIAAAGSYTVTVTDISGCKNTASQSVNINPLPVALITPGGPTTFCQGGSVNLNASGGTGYLWSNAATTAMVTILSAGTYGVTVTDANGCTNTANQAVQVNPLPVALVTPNGPTAFCPGSSVVLIASGGNGYHWSDGATTTMVTVTTSGIYSVTVTDVNGCVNSVNQSVTVYLPPVALITPGGPTTFCQGGSVILTASGGSGYLWSNGASTVAIMVSIAGAFTVTVTDANGCINPASQAVTVNPLPATTFTGPVTVCQDDPNVSVYEAIYDPLTTYTWTIPPPSGGKGIVTPDPLVPGKALVYWTGTGAADLKLEAVTSSGCYSSGQKSIFINAKPLVSLQGCFDLVTIPGARPFLLNGGTPKGVNGVYSGEGVTITGGLYLFTPAAVPGPFPKNVTITYIYTNFNGCLSSDTKIISVMNPPTFRCDDPVYNLKDIRTPIPYKSYNTYWKGNRCWMTENLDYGTESDPASPQTDNCQPQKYCPDAAAGGCSSGGFYQWDELMRYQNLENSQGICPPGSHVPSSPEWQALIDDEATLTPGNGIAGDFLKPPYKFNSVQKGIYYMNNTWAFTSGTPTGTMFWTSTSVSGKAVARGMNAVTPSVSYYESSRANAMQVRCVMD